MTNFPAVCESCGCTFSSPFSTGGNTNIIIHGGIKTNCPKCGGVATIPDASVDRDGNFQFANSAYKLLSNPVIHPDTIERLKLIIEEERKSDQSKPITVILEPWATEFQLPSDDYLDFISDDTVPEDGYFSVHTSNHGIIVYPEWERALVYVISSSGEKID